MLPVSAEFLRRLKRSGVRLGLDRMRDLVAALNNPHERIPVVHIAGTNGKGSVAAMVEAMVRRSGLRTGLYTSPHLIRLGERIQVNRLPLGDHQLAQYVDELWPVIDGLVRAQGSAAQPSYFEFMTALAFTHFARERCDLAIIEVGMGGRLDATNVVKPEVSVITSIGLDHMEFLGNTVEAIAAEKAGIIKSHRPVVIGMLSPAAEEVVRTIAAREHAPIASVRDVFGVDPNTFPATNLSGDYQRVNAATALLAVRQLRAPLRPSEDLALDALRAIDWPGRWQEILVGSRRVIVDTSHNAEGASVLERNLSQLVTTTGRRPIVVLGALGISRARPLVEAACRYARELRLVVPKQGRACGHAELEALVPPTFRGATRRDAIEALFPSADICLPDESNADDVVVTGSIYLAGEVLVRLNPASGPLDAEWQDFG